VLANYRSRRIERIENHSKKPGQKQKKKKKSVKIERGKTKQPLCGAAYVCFCCALSVMPQGHKDTSSDSNIREFFVRGESTISI